jgi:hypothetical protein
VQVHLGLIIIAKVALILSLYYIALLFLFAFAKCIANVCEEVSESFGEFLDDLEIMILGQN